ncbi:NADPH-dependent FMN reductase [Hoyosella altamirensis]|uniref:NAD(P)H-dependent FMN reductase n=1 Tax=Hoyosella altamirensis TaxID=616997 RepID=A0A839RIL1_9ACTN|nr:NAD(P)H-dependent oxidoreductase [Hoyosella altamirensis]MBB3036024.1 NAD(P)H-dependent FMN reductase [Hoyosella altamirensis]
MSGDVLFIVGSVRPVRVGDQLGEHIVKLFEDAGDARITMVDLRELALPFLDEPKMPALGKYEHEHTKRWSDQVAGSSAVVILTPEYNWGYPASVKNAVDYLYKEWKDKPALLISYGGGGGKRCYEQLLQVLGRVGMQLAETRVNIVLRDAYGDDDRLKDAAAIVDRESDVLIKAWQELQALIANKDEL